MTFSTNLHLFHSLKKIRFLCRSNGDLTRFIPRDLGPRVRWFEIVSKEISIHYGFSPGGLGLGRYAFLGIACRCAFLIWWVLTSLSMWSVCLTFGQLGETFQLRTTLLKLRTKIIVDVIFSRPSTPVNSAIFFLSFIYF